MTKDAATCCSSTTVCRRNDVGPGLCGRYFELGRWFERGNLRCQCDFALGLEDYPAAIALHRKVLRAHQDNALAHYHLGFAYGMTGRTTDEIREYLIAVRLSLDKWDLFLNLGLAFLAQKDWPNAIKTLQIAVLLGPDHPEAHFNLAIAYEMSGRLGESIQEITAALHLAPKDPEERNAKAIICARRAIWSARAMNGRT